MYGGISLLSALFIKKLLKKEHNNSLKGRKNLGIVITGGSYGFGASLVTEFLKLGHRVVTCSRSEPKEKISDSNYSWFKCDITQEKECQDFIKFSKEKLGEIDVVVLNAGTAGTIGKKFHETSFNDTNSCIGTDLIASMTFCRILIPLFKEQKLGGHLFFVGGLGSDGNVRAEGFSNLGVSKAGLTYLHKVLVHEYKDENFGIHTIHPGMLLSSQDFTKLKHLRKLANIMGATTGSVAKDLCPRMLNVSGTNQQISQISLPWIMYRFIISPISRNNYVDEETGKVLIDLK